MDSVCKTVVWSLMSKSKISLKKTGLTDQGMAIDIKKNPVCATPPVVISLSDRPGHFWARLPVATPRSYRPAFLYFFLGRFRPTRQWLYHGLSGFFFFIYFRLGHQWPYQGLTDWVCGMVTDILGQKSDKIKKKNQSVRPWYGHWC